mgnify:CR=1 FL=1
MALTVKAAALRKELTRVLGNVSKRNTRLKQKDVKGANLVTERTDTKIAEIRSLPLSNYGEIKSALAQARKLNENAGTRARSFDRAAKRAYRDDLVAQANDPFKVTRMTKDQLSEIYAIQRSRLRDKVRRVKKGIDGNNFMTRKVDAMLEQDPKSLNHNQLRSFVNNAAKHLNSKTLTVTGAKKQLQQGIDMFGEAYTQMTDDQRGAVWEAMRRQMEHLGLASGDAAEIVNGVVNDQKYMTMFLTAPTGELQAVIGQGLNDTRAKYHKAQVENRVARNILRRGFEKKGTPLPDFLLEDDEEDQPFFF